MTRYKFQSKEKEIQICSAAAPRSNGCRHILAHSSLDSYQLFVLAALLVLLILVILLILVLVILVGIIIAKISHINVFSNYIFCHFVTFCPFGSPWLFGFALWLFLVFRMVFGCFWSAKPIFSTCTCFFFICPNFS